MKPLRVWRDVVRVERRWDESATFTAKRASWKATPVHTLFLSCGHVVTRRGFGAVPKAKVACKRCEAGQPPIPLDVAPGRFAAKAPEMPDFMTAIIANEREVSR